jgi:hypothetical protein
MDELLTPCVLADLRSRAGAFARRHHVDPEEAVAEAYYHGARVAAHHCPERGSFDRYLHFVIHRHLCEWLDREVRQPPRPPPRPPGFPLGTFLAELSQDATVVVRLVLYGPGFLAAGDRPGLSGAYGKKVRQALRSYLEGLGWPRHRVSSAFTEVQEALK